MSYTSLKTTKWELPSVSYWESLDHWQFFLCLARNFQISQILLPIQVQHTFPYLVSVSLSPLYPAPFASSPRRCVPQLLLSVELFFVFPPDSKLPQVLFMVTCLIPSCLGSQPSTGLSAFFKGFSFFLGSRRGNRDHSVNTGACLQGALSTVKRLGK